MIKMVALKRFHYPSGPTGRDYHAGEEVTVLSERDVKALRLLRAVKDVAPEKAAAQPPQKPAPAPTPQPPPPPPTPAPQPSPAAVQEESTVAEEPEPYGVVSGAVTRRRGRYGRRDMKPEETSGDE